MDRNSLLTLAAVASSDPSAVTDKGIKVLAEAVIDLLSE